MPRHNPDKRGSLDEPVIPIGTVAGQSGLSVYAIRKYEAEGLLIPHRKASGHRLFSREDLERIRMIRHMIQDMGLNMAGIRMIQALLPCWTLVGCSEKQRSRGAAYRDTSQPCWVIKGGKCSERGNECRRCVVYRFGSQRTENLKSLAHNRLASQELSREVYRILEGDKEADG